MKIANVEPYEGFSKVFDKVISDSKYEKWEKFIKEIWAKNNFLPKSLVDIACGTGINSIRFAEHGIEVFGVDTSSSMLEEAKKKGSNVNFLKGHFLNFNLTKKVDAAICLDFSTNYILMFDEFLEFLERVYGCLKENGIFIFDFKPTKSFVKKEKHLSQEDFTYDWVCNIEYTPFVIIDIKITLKGKEYRERHVERGYTVGEMKKLLEQTNFKIIGIYDDCNFKDAGEESDLIQVVLRK